MKTSSWVQIMGGISLVAGAALLAQWLGFIVLGVLLLTAGVGMELEERNGTRQPDPAIRE